MKTLHKSFAACIGEVNNSFRDRDPSVVARSDELGLVSLPGASRSNAEPDIPDIFNLAGEVIPMMATQDETQAALIALRQVQLMRERQEFMETLLAKSADS
jgi:hypothetical protein